jgi:hypothetical protein
MNNLTIFIYYAFCIIIIFLTGYVVFVLNHSGWWFILCLAIIQMSPTSKSKKEDKE